MEFIQGSKLTDVWYNLEEREISSILRQLVQLESRMMAISFPAGGSLYYARDLEKVAGGLGVPLEDERFCVGPDTRLHLWSGRRSQLDVNRGPYDSAEAVLVTAAHKELAYLKQFSQPLLPFGRLRRGAYKYQEQSPSDHIENLNRYLLIASSLVPLNPALTQFCIRHPDLQPSNIIVAKSSDSADWQIVSLIDWQHASILPLFLSAGIPGRFQNYDDPISQSMIQPSLLEIFNELNQIKQKQEEDLYRRRLGHYHYLKSTEECNEPHHAVLSDPLWALRGRLFCRASEPWEGETFELKVALIEAAKKWKALTGPVGTQCPIVFDAEDVVKTMKLDEKQIQADKHMKRCKNIICLGTRGWVPAWYYEEAMARSQKIKEGVIAAAADSEEELAEIRDHWPFDDMDEEKYM